METSKNGIELIKRFEGCRLEAYRDAAGVVTIGYGWTKPVDGRPLRMGMRITQERAEALLKDGLSSFEANVAKHDGKYHWSQNQFDALVSFAYNIGSIDQLTANGTRSIQEIARKMTQYCKAGGRTLDGLVRRREAERDLFLKPVQKPVQAAEIEPQRHVQMNYRPGKEYTVAVSGLRIRKKKAAQDPLMLPKAAIAGVAGEGEAYKNLATARVGDAIWMCIWADGKGTEHWLCADSGEKAYVQ